MSLSSPTPAMQSERLDEINNPCSLSRASLLIEMSCSLLLVPPGNRGDFIDAPSMYLADDDGQGCSLKSATFIRQQGILRVQ